MTNSSFISTAEWNSYINASLQELWGLIVQKFGDDYYMATPYSFTTDGINELFALPADFFKVIAVDLQLNGSGSNTYVTLRPFTVMERNRWALPYAVTWALPFGTNLRYRINGSNIWLSPLPMAGLVLRLRYAPRFTSLVNDADTFDGVNGWEELAIADVCIKAMSKEESDISGFMAQKAALIERLEAEAENRDAANPATVADTSYAYGWGSGMPDGGGWGP
jgi:hypothetical protein